MDSFGSIALHKSIAIIRQRVALLAIGFVCMSVVAADDRAKPVVDDDPVATALTKAMLDYQASVEAAGEKLVAAFADQQKKLEENTKLKVAEQIQLVEQIQAERKAFEEDPGKLPNTAGMRAAVSVYRTKTAAANKRCEAAFDTAAERYRDKKDLAAAKAVLAEKFEFVMGTSRIHKLLTSQKWIHRREFIYNFHKDGSYVEEITKRRGQYAISKDQNQVTLRWDNETVVEVIYTQPTSVEWRMAGGMFMPKQ